MIRFIEKLIEVIGWLQIMISPSLLGFFIGLIIYYNFQNIYGLIIGIIIFIIGVVFGYKLATTKFNKTGSIDFLSRIHASPDLTENNEAKK